MAKTLSKNTRVKHASKNTSYRSQLSVDFQNRFKRSWDLLLLKKTRSYQFPTTPTQLPTAETRSAARQASLHETSPTLLEVLLLLRQGTIVCPHLHATVLQVVEFLGQNLPRCSIADKPKATFSAWARAGFGAMTTSARCTVREQHAQPRTYSGLQPGTGGKAGCKKATRALKVSDAAEDVQWTAVCAIDTYKPDGRAWKPVGRPVVRTTESSGKQGRPKRREAVDDVHETRKPTEDR